MGVILALVEPVDPPNVHVGHAVSLSDGNRAVRDGNYSLCSKLSKGSSTDLKSGRRNKFWQMRFRCDS